MERQLGAEDGTTLVEISMVVALLGLIVTFILMFLTTSQASLGRDISRSSTNDDIRLAIQSLDREVRSGNVLYNPALESYTPGDIVSGMSVRVYTQSNSAFKCVQWRINSNAELQRRDWAPDWQSSGEVHGWRTIATGIRNRADNKGAAFSRPLSNLLSVDIWANDDPTAKKGQDVEVTASIAGRNTVFYTANQLCGSAVPDPSLTGSNFTPVPLY